MFVDILQSKSNFFNCSFISNTSPKVRLLNTVHQGDRTTIAVIPPSCTIVLMRYLIKTLNGVTMYLVVEQEIPGIIFNQDVQCKAS